jgi:hypothetical protein
MTVSTNPQRDLAFDYVRNTQQNIFLTGKAGTGKTTFLHQIKQDSPKRMVIVAPTGVAAINAGGMTIHSFFQLPFGPYLPDRVQDSNAQRKFTREKIRLIKSLDLLVIDEISMVRADVLDGIDAVLRRYRDGYKPFGGVQLLMIGDLHQLPPVVRDEEWFLLRSTYETPYFFSSLALQQSAPISIELKHIYRQSDTQFIELLNRVRGNQIDATVLEMLNSRYIPHFKPRDQEPYITLTALNAEAQEINAEKLEEIASPLALFKATITGEFPTHAYPTEENLEFKLNAQVMFVKNDVTREKRYYNGKIGVITKIEENAIHVQCPQETETIVVARVEWNNVKYSLNEQTKEVTENIIGSFVQFPLKLAWAITIHKSQGLTFERAIIDAQAAFAHGQVYVALSRCKSFEGIVLRSKIVSASVKTDATVRNYTEEADKNAPDEAHLLQSKMRYQQNLILELFSFSAFKKVFVQLQDTYLTHEKAFHPDSFAKSPVLHQDNNAFFATVDKFQEQIKGLLQSGMLPESDPVLQARVQKASSWFAEQLQTEFGPATQKIPLISDDQSIEKSVFEALENFRIELFVKKACLLTAQSGFSSQQYLRTKTNAELDFRMQQNRPADVPPPAIGTHPVLLQRLKKWRVETANTLNIEAFQVFSTKLLIEIAEQLPTQPAELKRIKGVGASKLKQFGPEVLAMIHQYCTEKSIAFEPLAADAFAPVPKVDTKMVSLEMYQSGKSIEAIAAERSMVPGTIEGHLSHFIGTGVLDIADFLPMETVETISQYFVEHQTTATGAAKVHFEDKYSFGQLRMVLKHLERNGFAPNTEIQLI